MNPIARRPVSRCGLALLVSLVSFHATGPLTWGQDESTLPAKVTIKTEKKDDHVIRINGRLSATDPLDSVRMNSYHQIHNVPLKAGLAYIIEMRRTNPTALDPYLRLEDESGFNLAEDDDSGGGQTARILFTPPEDGEYRIITTSFGDRQEGAYELVITGRPGGLPTSPPGAPVTTYQPTEFGDIVITPFGQPNAIAPGAGGFSQAVLHGYIEYRFEVENRSAKNGHQVTLILPRYRDNHWGGTHHLGAVKKTVDVAPEAKLQVSLFQPDLPLNSNNLEVVIDGQSQEGEVPLAIVRGNGNHRLLSGGHIRSSVGGGADITVLVGSDLASAIQANIYKSSIVVIEPEATVIPPEEEVLPPGVVAPPPMPAGHGKRGVFVEKGSPHNGKKYSYPMNHAIFSAGPEMLTTRSWLGFTPYDGIVLGNRTIDALAAETRAALWQYVECGGTLVVVGNAKLPESWRLAPTNLKGCMAAAPGFGKCLVFDEVNVGRWSPDDWKLIADTWDQSRGAWNQLTSITQAHIQFPVVENLGIPVRGLFGFMFAFVILIGPVNIFWLSRTNRRLWLLWTVPVFSLLTTGLLFAYMALSEGWHAHVRGVGITVLDESSQRASSIGWLGYYSPTTSRGLHFSADTELSPHFEPEGHHRHRGGETSRGLTIDWTNDQHLDSGWVTPKVPLHFLVRRSEKRLERLSARRDGEDIVIVNGLKVDIQKLRFADKDGVLFNGAMIPAGAECRLKRTGHTVGKTTTLHERFNGNWLNLARDLQTSVEVLQPGTYLAVLGDSPFLEQGLRDTQSRTMEAVVFGISKEAP